MTGWQRIFQGFALAVLMLSTAACTTTNQMAASDFVLPKKDARIIILEPNTDIALVTAGGVREARADWTEAAATNLNDGFKAELGTKGVNATFQPPEKDIDAQTRLLAETVMFQAIINRPQSGAVGLPTKKGKFEWTIGEAVKPLREAYDADYAMFVYSEGNYASAANIAMQVILPALFGQVNIPQTSAQSTLISLIDLKDGDLVWIDSRYGGDVRTAEQAKTVAADLVKRLPLEGTKTAPKPATPEKTAKPVAAETPAADAAPAPPTETPGS